PGRRARRPPCRAQGLSILRQWIRGRGAAAPARLRAGALRRKGASMKITGVTTHLLSANWAAVDQQWEDVGGGYKSSALVRIETDAGITGLGEVIIGYFAPEAVPT